MKTIHDTYKSLWIEEDNGCYTRLQKPAYAFENLVPNILFKIPKARNLAGLLGKKAQEVDSYKYYSKTIENYQKKGDRSRWIGEFNRIHNQIANYITQSEPLVGLDISGEPGFFAEDALKHKFAKLCVTAFANEVVTSIISMGLDSFKFDFNADSLFSKYKENSLDIVFARYSIGFCINIEKLFFEISSILKPEGFFYTSFSPASRAVCARWMFDDYAYLKQWTTKYIKDSAKKAGLQIVDKFDENIFKWDENWSPLVKYLSRPYTKNLFMGCSEDELYQRSIAILFKKA